MRKKTISVVLGLALMLVSVVGVKGVMTDKKEDLVGKSNIIDTMAMDTTWTKIDNAEPTYVNCSNKKEFNLKETSEEADYVFKGTVTKCEEFEVQWQDEKGEPWGPYPSSVVTVDISEEYYGESPVSGNSIKVYYPFAVSMKFLDGFTISEGYEYVFVTNALDEEFVENRNKNNPDDKFEQEKYADVYISDTMYDLMAVEDEKVLMYEDYCYCDEEIMEQTVTGDAVEEVVEEIEEIAPAEEVIEKGDFVLLNIDIISDLLNRIFEYPEEMPDAKDLKGLHEEMDRER